MAFLLNFVDLTKFLLSSPVVESVDESDIRPPLSPKDPYYDALNVWVRIT